MEAGLPRQSVRAAWSEMILGTDRVNLEMLLFDQVENCQIVTRHSVPGSGVLTGTQVCLRFFNQTFVPRLSSVCLIINACLLTGLSEK